MATDTDKAQALFNKPNERERPPTVDEFGMGGDYNGSLGDFVREHNALVNAGDNVGLLPPDDRDSIFGGGRQNLFDVEYQSPTRSPNAAFNEVFSNAWIKGGVQDPLIPQIETAKAMITVQDELVDTLINAYQDDEFTQKRLEKLHELPHQEQMDVLNFEIDRRDAHKISAREALLIHVFRAGHSDLSIPAFDKVKRQFNPTELDQFRQQLRDQQVRELRGEVDKVVARTDIGTTAQAVGDILQQDFIPLFNVATRELMSNRALGAVDGEIGWFRSLFPGEVRQEIREQFANATPDERIEYVRNIGEELEALKNGPYGSFFTEYGVLENYMEIFSEELLQENIPKSTLDRILGNLDVVLEAALGIGLLVKFGGRTTKQAFRTTNAVQARRLSRAAGNHKLRAKLDAELGVVIREAGVDPSEAALVHMPKPPSLVNDREVLPDPLKQQVEGAERVREQILVNSDDLTGLGLSVDDKVNVVRKEINELDAHDTIVINPQMSVLQALPNDTGFRYTAVYGATPERGWSNLGDLLDDASDVFDETAEFKIMRRNADGELEEVPRSEWPARAKGVDVGEGFGLNNLSDEELLQLSRQVEPESDAFKALEEEAMRRASGDREFIGDALRTYDGEDYYIQLDHERFWHTADKAALSPSTWRNGAGVLGKFLLTPSMRFGDGIFSSFDKAYRIEQATIRRFEQIYKPYYDLNHSDRVVVHNIMEWVEQTAKENGRVPDIAQIMAQFDGVTQKQLGGVLSLNQGLNVQWELFNRRLYREWHTQGYKSAIPRAEGMAKYHGQVIERPRGSQTVYDPITQKQVVMTADEIEDLYHEGGGLMKLDLAVDIPGEPGKASTLIRVSNEDYKIGALSSEVLEYHPGYFSRFYQDPYFIVKRTGKEVDGKQTDLVEDAIRTAGSTEEADRFLRRFATFNRKTGLWVNNEDPSKSYRIQRAADLDNTESSLFTKQALNREGRLFWDKRNADRLPDVNGNRAELEDPVKALNRSTVMATRQTTHEDLMKTMKGAFEKEFEDVLPDAFATQSISQTLRDLKSARRNAAEESLKKRYDQAIEFAEYIRLQQGTDEVIVPFLREQAIRVASWISRMSGRAPSLTIQNAGFKFSRVLENTFQNMDPFRTMRSAAFNLWMVLRPGRQLLLQGAQISFLTALDPLYVASGRVFRDGILLRRGLMKLTKSNYDDGFNSKLAAKMMGLTRNQYKRLIQEVDRSGIIDTVDVHAFAGGAHRPKKSYDQPVLYTGKYLGKARQAMQTYGFDMGEQINLANTFMVSLRRYMRENGVSDLMKLERSQWDEVAEDAMQLALGMTKPNKMWYQSGMVGTMTQFLTFQHRAALAIMRQNPALRPWDGAKILLSTYLLFGAHTLGGADWARSKLSAMGLDRFADKYIEGFGGTLVDLMAYGLIQTGFNAIMQATMEDFKDLDLEFLAPGANVKDIYENLLQGLAETPWGTAMGPFGNVAQGILESADFVLRIRQGSELTNATKAMRSADYLMRNLVPQYNDAMTTYLYYKTGTWANRSGRVLPAEFEGNWLNAMARASIGARSIEEMRFYYANNEIWENEENFRSVIKGNRDFLIKNLNLYYDGALTKEFLQEQLDMLVAWSEDWPPHLKDEILRQSLITENEDGVSPITIMAEKAKQITPDIIAIIDELPEVQGGDKEALREALEEIYNQRIENNEVLMEDLKEEDGRWLN